MKNKTMQAIILAGGLGTRLKSIVHDVPKPMARIQDHPFLAYLLASLNSQQINHIVFSVHHYHEHIQAYFGNEYRGMKLEYAIEEQLLGTGGAIRHSLSYLDLTQPALVLNGDSFSQLNYHAMLQQHINSASTLTIALRYRKNCQRYGVAQVQNDKITHFSPAGSHQEGLINAGIYLMNPSIFNGFSLSESFSFEHDFLYPYIQQLQPSHFITDGYFIDIGVPDDYHRACRELPLLQNI
jgi:D-glycero-alpha-D-manno-heptose 1-phosphate guanylyltransferase